MSVIYLSPIKIQTHTTCASLYDGKNVKYDVLMMSSSALLLPRNKNRETQVSVMFNRTTKDGQTGKNHANGKMTTNAWFVWQSLQERAWPEGPPGQNEMFDREAGGVMRRSSTCGDAGGARPGVNPQCPDPPCSTSPTRISEHR